MTKRIKILCLIVAIITLISTLSFATEIQPRDVVEDTDEGEPVVTSEIQPREDEETEEVEEYEEPEWVNSDLYKAGDVVEVSQIVDGNAFIVAQEVKITGEIGGNAFIVAKKITLDGGYVYSSLYAVAEEIIIDGIVYDAYVTANTLTIGENGYVYRDLRAAANTLNLNGPVRRDAYLAGNTINFKEDAGVLIGNNLKYSSDSEIAIPEDAVQGEVTFNKEEIKEESVVERVTSHIFSAINALVYTLAVVLLAIWLAPKFVERVGTMEVGKAFASLGIGVIAPIAIIIALVILLISSICSKLAIAATLIFVAICMSGTAFACIYFASLFTKLVKWEGKVKFAISAGVISVLVWALSSIPVIGGFIGYAVSSLGFGTLILNIVCKKEKAPVVEEKAE